MRIAFYRGRHRLFDRVVQWWTRGQYSHCELITGGPYDDGTVMCASASFLDDGVRYKRITLHPDRWDVFALDDADPTAVVEWFDDHDGAGYDIAGLFGFLWRPHHGTPSRWFCSEAIAAALGFRDPWRFCPNTLFAALIERQPIPAAV